MPTNDTPAPREPTRISCGCYLDGLGIRVKRCALHEAYDPAPRVVGGEPQPLAAVLHDWMRDEDGEIDVFAYYPADPHNGPRCVRCGEGFCHHCDPDCYAKPCAAPALPVGGAEPDEMPDPERVAGHLRDAAADARRLATTAVDGDYLRERAVVLDSLAARLTRSPRAAGEPTGEPVDLEMFRALANNWTIDFGEMQAWAARHAARLEERGE